MNNKKILGLLFMLFCLVGVVKSASLASQFILEGNGWSIVFNDTEISRTNISCNNVIGASYDVCAGDGGGSGSNDGNASSICGDNLVLLGQDITTCINLNDTIDARAVSGGLDGNVSSICPDNEVLLGQDSPVCIDLNATIDARENDTTIGNCSVSGSCVEIVYIGEENKTIIVYQNISNLPTCAGTDKLTYDGSTLSCAADVVGSGGGVGMWAVYGDYVMLNASAGATNKTFVEESRADTLWGDLDCTNITGGSDGDYCADTDTNCDTLDECAAITYEDNVPDCGDGEYTRHEGDGWSCQNDLWNDSTDVINAINLASLNASHFNSINCSAIGFGSDTDFCVDDTGAGGNATLDHLDSGTQGLLCMWNTTGFACNQSIVIDTDTNTYNSTDDFFDTLIADKLCIYNSSSGDIACNYTDKDTADTDTWNSSTDFFDTVTVGMLCLYNSSGDITCNQSVVTDTDTDILDGNEYNSTQFDEDTDGYLHLIESWVTSFIDNWFTAHAGGNSTTDFTDSFADIHGVVNTTTNLAGEVTGTYNNVILDHDALDDQYYDSESDLTGLLDDNYAAIHNTLNISTSFSGDVSGTYNSISLDTDTVQDNEIDYIAVTLDDFTNDVNFIANNTDARVNTLNVTADLGMENKNITYIDCILFASGGKICSG